MGTVNNIYERNKERKQFTGKRTRQVLSLSDSIRKRKSVFGISIIGEFKRRSPSGFVNLNNTGIESYLSDLNKLGVSGFSVLTEPDYFSGSYDDLKIASGFGIPVLDKDFISDEKMIESAYNAGADCILLIADFLGADKLKSLASKAASYSMESLIEFHDPDCIEKIPEDEHILIGYNRRNLRTLKMEGKEMEVIDTLMDKEVITVLESGLVADSIPQGIAGKFDAFLIGESLLNSSYKEVEQ